MVGMASCRLHSRIFSELKKARPEGREILAMGCLQGAP
ncbi:hypothetical protein JSMCR1_p529 (plasmid) [Escherichia coli]|nr:hypothetical protein JSMCR1_p529 [Escherichia coli]